MKPMKKLIRPVVMLFILFLLNIALFGYIIGVFSPKMAIPRSQYSDDWKGKILQYLKNKWLARSWRTPRLWPEQDSGDRIIEQLSYIPPNLYEVTQHGKKLKTILLRNGSSLWIIPTHSGQQTFQTENCSVNTCRITSNVSEFQEADAVFFTDITKLTNETRPSENQIWVMYILESPFHTKPLPKMKIFNWTVSYRPDSEVPNPYGKFYLYDPAITFKRQNINYAFNKTKMVAWFTTNCFTPNKRLQYAIELSKYIDVDIYGGCIRNNTLLCPKSQMNKCAQMLKRDYKFYLSFENSNCRHYITEKLFYVALGNDVLPIVMGAKKEDYEMAAPYHSFIHVDDFESPKHLADYLHILDKDDTLYNEYFQWKGTGHFSPYLNAHFWCRFCAMLHSKITRKTYENVDAWWRRNGTCTAHSWRNIKQI